MDTNFANQGNLILKYPWKEGTIEGISTDKNNNISIFGFPTTNMKSYLGICNINLNKLKDTNQLFNVTIKPFEIGSGKDLIELMSLTKYSRLYKTKENHFITAGSEKINTVYGLSIYKYNDSGKLIKSFGKNGRSFIPFGNNEDDVFVTNILSTKNNKIFVSVVLNQTNVKQSYLFIFNEKGQFEKKVLINNLKNKPFASQKIIENNNGIIFMGTIETKESLYSSYFIKFDYSGKIDKTFGQAGIINISEKILGNFIPYTFTTDNEENIYLTNSLFKDNGNIGVMCIKKNGTIDKSIFKNRFLYLDNIPHYYRTFYISMHNENQIYLLFAGYNFDASQSEMCLKRLKITRY